MEVFRICRELYSDRITASGFANRWNFRGQFVVYSGSSRSLSTLELVVHRNSIISGTAYKVMVISIPDDESNVRQIRINELPANWRTMEAVATLQQIGVKWYNEQRSLLLKVPSIIIPYEYNYVINTEHPDFKKDVVLARIEDYYWDNRLL